MTAVRTPLMVHGGPKAQKASNLPTACQLLWHKQPACLLLSKGCACMQISEKLNADNIPCSLITGAHARSQHPAVQLSLCSIRDSLQLLRLGLTTGQSSLSLLVSLKGKERQLMAGAKRAACTTQIVVVTWPMDGRRMASHNCCGKPGLWRPASIH